MWVLIIVATMYSDGSGFPVGVSVHSVPDFNSRMACITAGNSLPNPVKANGDESSIRFYCVNRSDQ
jgi:hypothetical protein